MSSNVRGWKFVRSRQLLRVGLTGVTLIMLLAGSVGQARSAGSQQTGFSYNFVLYSRELQKKRYVCAGEKIHILVRLLSGHKPAANIVRLDYVSGVPVTALVTGGTGTVTPDKAFLGFNSAIPEGAEFVFTAAKKGKEKIFFEALGNLPDQPEFYVEQPLEFEVKNCKYKASLIYRSQQLGWSVNRTGYWMEYGNMEEVLLEPDEQGNFEVVGLYQFGGYLTNMAECPWTFTGSDLQVDIAGNLVEDVVNLAFDFGFPEVTVSFCSGSYTSPPAALLGQQDAAIPITGGVTNIIVPVPNGAPAPSGTAAITVIVQPEAEQAVSRTDHPVMWLAEWFKAASFLPDMNQ